MIYCCIVALTLGMTTKEIKWEQTLIIVLFHCISAILLYTFLGECVDCADTNLQTPSFLSLSVSVHWWVRCLETARSQLCQFDQYWHCVSLCVGVRCRHTCMFEFVRLITLGFCANRAELLVSVALAVCVWMCAYLCTCLATVCVLLFLWLSLFVLWECVVAPSRHSHLHSLHQVWMEATPFL